MRAGEIQRLQTGANDRFLQCRQGLPQDEFPSCQRFIENSLPASRVAIRGPDISMNIAFRSSPPTAPPGNARSDRAQVVTWFRSCRRNDEHRPRLTERGRGHRFNPYSALTYMAVRWAKGTRAPLRPVVTDLRHAPLRETGNLAQQLTPDFASAWSVPICKAATAYRPKSAPRVRKIAFSKRAIILGSMSSWSRKFQAGIPAQASRLKRCAGAGH